MDTRGKTNKHTAQSSKAARHIAARKATHASGGMGLLSRALAVLLAINMIALPALPLGIFAGEITLEPGSVEAEYGEGAGTTAPEAVPAAPVTPAAPVVPAAETTTGGGGLFHL